MSSVPVFSTEGVVDSCRVSMPGCAAWLESEGSGSLGRRGTYTTSRLVY